MKHYLLCVGAILAGAPAGAQDFVYKPMNPSFGGDSFNSSHMLSLADRQNQHIEDNDVFGRGGQDSTQQFRRQIESALLGRVASQISDRILGENASDSGKFKIDSTEISFHKIDGIVLIDIFDGISGGTTQIEIPDPAF